MRISDFDFELPEGAIARHPTPERDRSRLMLLDRRSSAVEHRTFAELPELLVPGDLLVVNDTKVLPARLRAHKVASRGKVEVLLVERLSPSAAGSGARERWRAMVNASKPVRSATRLALDRAPSIELSVIEEEGEGFVVLEVPVGVTGVELAHTHGEVPLPPYLGRTPEALDADRYQTLFARADAECSVAAPTAGLHFSLPLLSALQARGIERVPITLHVGPGTFLPVRVEEIDAHRMLPERYAIPSASAEAIERTRARGGRVIAVGTTVTRVLESAGRPTAAKEGATTLFIRPGHEFRGIDGLITNFHLPRSTLLMLVSAFAGRESVLAAYRSAIAEKYRFFSYGDAMLIC